VELEAELSLLGDEELLERAFENLVRNAREAAGAGGHVWVAGRTDREEVVITVSDDGPGLSEQKRQELRPFFTTKPGGLGLGLPIVHKVIGLHGGAILMSDRSPRGLVVTVRLPARIPGDA
jgi:signal transduction histidine kinase